MVLVVDDDPIALDVARERLERMGYQVTVREHALGTSQWIVDHRPDYVLLDIAMPALSGEALGQLLRQRGAPPHVILHSSRATDELERLTARIGALGYITKASDDREFSSRFRELAQARPQP
jgi:DNA-binding response OmpR family regulator